MGTEIKVLLIEDAHAQAFEEAWHTTFGYIATQAQHIDVIAKIRGQLQEIVFIPAGTMQQQQRYRHPDYRMLYRYISKVGSP